MAVGSKLVALIYPVLRHVPPEDRGRILAKARTAALRHRVFIGSLYAFGGGLLLSTIARAVPVPWLVHPTVLLRWSRLFSSCWYGPF